MPLPHHQTKKKKNVISAILRNFTFENLKSMRFYFIEKEIYLNNLGEITDTESVTHEITASLETHTTFQLRFMAEWFLFPIPGIKNINITFLFFLFSIM